MSAMKYIGDYSSLSHLFLCIHPSVFEMDVFSLRKAVTPFKQLRASAAVIQSNDNKAHFVQATLYLYVLE